MNSNPQPIVLVANRKGDSPALLTVKTRPSRSRRHTGLQYVTLKLDGMPFNTLFVSNN